MTLNTGDHKTILVGILKDIYNNIALADYLGFKGGTAAMFFYDLNRFSVDLDFDLLGGTQQDAVFGGVQDILKQYGTVKEARQKRYNQIFLLTYHNKLQNAYNIKVEINMRNFNSQYTTIEYLGIPMQVMIRQDMAAHKLVAMYERMGRANRDLYDVWFFLHNRWPINKDIIEFRTQMTYTEFLSASIEKLVALSDTKILDGLGELLNNSQKAWVKTSLKKDLIFLLQYALQQEL